MELYRGLPIKVLFSPHSPNNFPFLCFDIAVTEFPSDFSFVCCFPALSECGEDEYRCSDAYPICLKNHTWCDRTWDCLNGEDEREDCAGSKTYISAVFMAENVPQIL